MKYLILFTVLFLLSCNQSILVFEDSTYSSNDFTNNNEVNDFLSGFNDTIFIQHSKLLNLWGSTSCYIDFIHDGEEIGIASVEIVDSNLTIHKFKKWSINNEGIEIDFNEWSAIQESIISRGIASPDIKFINAETGKESDSDSFLDMIIDLSEEKERQN